MRWQSIALFFGTFCFGVAGHQTAAVAMSESPDAVASQAYEQWEAALGVRQECASGVSIVLEPLPDLRGEYRTATDQVVIDPDDGIDGMAGVVTHELAHHLFLACGAFADADFTTAFYAAQDLPRDRDWFDYSAGWSETPAEHFAEAVATVIAGGGEGGIAVTPEAVDIVTRWLAGAPIALPASETQNPSAYAADPSVTAVESDQDGVASSSLLIEPISTAGQPPTEDATAEAPPNRDQPAPAVAVAVPDSPDADAFSALGRSLLALHWDEAAAQLLQWLEGSQ